MQRKQKHRANKLIHLKTITIIQKNLILSPKRSKNENKQIAVTKSNEDTTNTKHKQRAQESREREERGEDKSEGEEARGCRFAL